MKIESHKEICLLIDKSLQNNLSQDEETSLREHLDSCPECQEYLEANEWSIAALEGFAFEATPGLNAQVHRSMRKLESDLKERRRSIRISAVAFTLSFLSSFLLWGPSDVLASHLHLAANDVQLLFLLFWVLPALFVAVCIPIFPSLLLRSQYQKGLMS